MMYRNWPESLSHEMVGCVRRGRAAREMEGWKFSKCGCGGERRQGQLLEGALVCQRRIVLKDGNDTATREFGNLSPSKDKCKVLESWLLGAWNKRKDVQDAEYNGCPGRVGLLAPGSSETSSLPDGTEWLHWRMHRGCLL